MQKEEIWLRLLAAGTVSGEKMAKVALQLVSHEKITPYALAQLGLSDAQIARFQKTDLASTYRWLEREGHHLLTLDSPAYPEQLRAIDWCPGALFVWGDISVLNKPQLAMVGSRVHSLYGKHWGDEFARELARAGLVITSGLARGIDGVAHRGALTASGKTIAVMGSGFRHIYPKQHNLLATDIIEQGGAIVSEFPYSAIPLPHHFPRRNRIISGLSLGVLVVEATLKSGSMITCRYALEQGRDVFALPGALSNPGSEGPNWLLKQGAVPVTEPQDILAFLQNELQNLPLPDNNPNYCYQHSEPPLPFPELLANVGDEVTSVDVVAERACQPVPLTVAQLLELELAGWIAAVPGGYVRLRRASHVRRTNVFIRDLHPQ